MTPKSKIFGLAFALSLQAGSATASMEIHSDPIRPSVDVAIDISGIWGDSCVPDRPSSVLFEPNRIEFEIGTSLHNGGCDFLSTPYQLTVSRLNIPLSAPIQSGPVVVDSRAYNHHFSAGADIVLPEHVSEYVYLVDEQDQILIYRADVWELVEVLPADSANRIISDQTNLFVWSGPSKFEGRVSGYVDANFNMMVGHEGASEPVDIVTVPDDGLFDAFRYDSYVAFEDWLGSYRFEPVDLPVPPGGLARSDDSVFVTLPTMNAVMVINRYDGSLEQTIDVGNGPTLAHQNTALDRVIVSNAGEQTISLIESATGAVITTTNVGANVVQFTYSNAADQFFAVLENGDIRGISASDGQLTGAVSLSRPAIGVSMNQAQTEMYVLLPSNAGTDIAIVDPLTLQTMGTRHLPTTAQSIAHYTSESYWMLAPNGSVPVAVPVNGAVWLMGFILLLAVLAWMHLRPVIDEGRV